MPVQFWPRPVAVQWRSTLWRYRLPAALAACALLTQACASIPPHPFAGAQVSDPDTRVPPVAYRPVFGSYSSQRPVEPAPWRKRNDGVVPEPKKGGQ